MKSRRRGFKKDKGEQNFWPSFTDMISTIALILFFLMILAYIQNIVTGKNLEVAKRNLDESKAEISRAENRLDLLGDKLDEVKAEVKEGERELKLSEKQIEEQKEIIAESNRELGQLRAKLKGIALFRVEVLDKVKSTVENELGETNSEGEDLVSIASNGNIVINEKLVFDYDSYNIKPEGRKLLSNLANAFENVLDDSDIRQNIDAINIQGHTDRDGSSEYNRKLSTNRATAVVNYMLNANDTLENRYGSYFLASGYSEFRPITDGDTTRAQAKNRRIEISLILKDSNVRDVIDEYLEESMEVFEEDN